MLIGVALLGIDQLIKLWLLRYIPETVVVNPGLAIGLNNKAWILSLILIAILLIGWLYFSSRDKTERIFLALVLGGSLSNLIDRLTRDGVVDYIRVPNVSNFNLADVGVVLGVGLLVFHYLFRSRSRLG